MEIFVPLSLLFSFGAHALPEEWQSPEQKRLKIHLVKKTEGPDDFPYEPAPREHLVNSQIFAQGQISSSDF